MIVVRHHSSLVKERVFARMDYLLVTSQRPFDQSTGARLEWDQTRLRKISRQPVAGGTRPVKRGPATDVPRTIESSESMSDGLVECKRRQTSVMPKGHLSSK
jgi:hypothetical protein